MSLPLIVRSLAVADIQMARDSLETVRPGLGSQFIARVRAALERIELQPEWYGFVWQDVRAVRLRQFRHVVYYVAFADRVEVIALMHGAQDSSHWQSRV